MKLAAKVLNRKQIIVVPLFFQFPQARRVKNKRENGYAKTGVSFPFLYLTRKVIDTLHKWHQYLGNNTYTSQDKGCYSNLGSIYAKGLFFSGLKS